MYSMLNIEIIFILIKHYYDIVLDTYCMWWERNRWTILIPTLWIKSYIVIIKNRIPEETLSSIFGTHTEFAQVPLSRIDNMNTQYKL